MIGVRLVPLLVADGHEVVGMTRSAEKADGLRALGAEPVVCDVFDAARLRRAVAASRPETVLHELTALPDDPSLLSEFGPANARIRREGTQSPPEPPRVHVDEAARQTVAALRATPGILPIVAR